MIQILGVNITNLDQKTVTEALRSYLESDQQHYVVTPNPEFVVKAQSDEEFCQIVNEADLAVADGVGLQFAAKFLGQPAPPRITGNVLLRVLSELCSQAHRPMFLLGGEDQISEIAAGKLQEQYLNLPVASNPGGAIFYKDGEWNMSPAVMQDIQNFEPAVLVVALGHGKQEKWIKSFLPYLPSVKIAIGVGGALDFLAGRQVRAPKSFQRLGLEWLYRLLREPRRWKRIWTAVIVFPYLVIKSRISSK